MIRVQRQEARLELVPTPDVAGDNPVLEARLLEEDRDLFSVWGRPKMEVEQGLPRVVFFDLRAPAQGQERATLSFPRPHSDRKS